MSFRHRLILSSMTISPTQYSRRGAAECEVKVLIEKPDSIGFDVIQMIIVLIQDVQFRSYQWPEPVSVVNLLPKQIYKPGGPALNDDDNDRRLSMATVRL
jgi:hypothetical protein